MHRFIVYQYGKVGSTSLVAALESVPDCEAFQSHFLGAEPFQSTFDSLLNPDLSDFYFEHSSGQLVHNLRIYRHFLRRGQGPDQLTVVTLTREPYTWFQSALGQEIEAHKQSFQRALTKAGVLFDSDEQLVLKGSKQLLVRISQAIEVLGGIDAMSEEARKGLDKRMPFYDAEDFGDFLFILGRFLMPHVWFGAQFEEVMDGASIPKFESIGSRVLRERKGWGNIYLLRYEDLEPGLSVMMDDLGFDSVPALERHNIGSEKPFSDQLEEAFASEEGQSLRRLCTSRMSRFLGY